MKLNARGFSDFEFLKKMLSKQFEKTRLCDMKAALLGPSDPETVAPKVRVDVAETHMADKRALDHLPDEFLGFCGDGSGNVHQTTHRDC